MADKELTKVRSKFVEKVSKEVINQLLDGLLEDFVLNEGEKESILEENSARADRARDLIDTVKKKGDCASRRMITHLLKKDPTLGATLGLAHDEPAQREPQKEQSWSSTLIKTTETFWTEKQNDKDTYPVTKNSIKNRVALLITNIEFTDKSFNRRGAEKDEENMEKLLKDLGYDVVKHTNLTAKAINDALSTFSKHPKLKQTDSVFVVIMSHGKRGVVLGVDAKRDISPGEKQDEFPIDNIYKHLGTGNCPQLLNKPKVIIIQACRGGEKGSVFVCDDENAAAACDHVPQPGQHPSAEGDSIEEDALRFAHKERDFTSLLSCTPDTVSYRDIVRGSILIQYTVEVFNTLACKNHIEELSMKVMQRFEDFSSTSVQQMATKDRCTLLRNFYLFPGI